MIWIYPVIPAFGVAEFEIPSSFNPVGSGARAMGMGGAFIAAADDATAASWNPGGLIRLTLPEFSIVTAGFHRGEDIDFQINPEAAGSHSVSEKNINYLSVTYPFGLFNRNMVVSLSYQHLYDLSREWQFTFQNPMTGLENQWDVRQSGSLSALGLSYCIQMIPELSVGFTLNFWDENLGNNRWEQNFHADSGIAGMTMIRFDRKEKFSFSGFNANIGLLWRINYKLSLGAVFKTPFKADVKREIQESQIYEFEDIPPFSEEDTRNETIEMPMSYGIGFVYRLSDRFFMSADIYRTEWGDFIYREENGNEKSPVSARSLSESYVKPTHQIRAGAEYRFMNPNKGYIIPVRCGIFYDPAPAEGSPDDFYGFSLGSGFTLNDRFSLDIAYQYRFGNDVGDHILEPRGFSQDVKEHTLYFSVIFYLKTRRYQKMKSRKSNVLKSLKIVFIYLILLIFLPGLGLCQDSYTTAGFDFNGDCEINLPDAVIGLKILVGMDDVALSGEKEIGIEKIIALLQNMSGIRNIHCPTQDFIPCGFEDNYEEDDRFFQARTIALDNEEPQHHTFHDKGDEDWVVFYGISGQIYDIEVKIESLGSECNIVIELYDEASLVTGTPIASKDYAGAGKDETLRWEDCPADAVYYVKLKNSDPNVFGENIKYDLKINLPSAPLPGDIIGYVYDKDTGRKITGSFIRTSAGRTAISNYCNCNFYCARDYCIYFHPSGSYTLNAAAPGYKTVSVSITVKETVATAQDIVMSRTR